MTDYPWIIRILLKELKNIPDFILCHISLGQTLGASQSNTKNKMIHQRKKRMMKKSMFNLQVVIIILRKRMGP